MKLDETSSFKGIKFKNQTLFWVGLLCVIGGVVLQLPMYINAADIDYHLAGHSMGFAMNAGMILSVIGILITFYSLMPKSTLQTEDDEYRIKIQTMDDAPLNSSHVVLILVMAFAVTIDVMKPTTLSFVLPGFAKEYGLLSPVNPDGSVPAAYLPFCGITGTVLGSFLWGWLGDYMGRRASILMAGIIFIATSACGSMPMYWMNFLMCFFMGLGVGGMLPIMFTMIAEVIPARHRGWLMVLIGGDVAGAYIISSSLAAWLVPEYSWRILWLVGLPTGVLLILLTRLIPESPRFLLARGRVREAKSVMEQYGATIVKEKIPAQTADLQIKDRFLQLFQAPYHKITTTIILLAIGVGLVSFGFRLWIPSDLQKMGFSAQAANELLRNSALIGFPFTFVVAWLYGFWSSKKTILLLTGLTTLSLLGFAIMGNAVVQNKLLLYSLLIMPIWGISAVLAVLSAYAVEIYPTRIRSRGSGLAAGLSKAGGVLIIALVILAVAPPSIVGTALIGAIPLGLAGLAVAVFGLETRDRKLEEITAEQVFEMGT